MSGIYLTYSSSDPSCLWQLKDSVQVRILDLDAPDNQLLGLLPRLIVDVQRINLGSKVTTYLI